MTRGQTAISHYPVVPGLEKSLYLQDATRARVQAIETPSTDATRSVISPTSVR